MIWSLNEIEATCRKAARGAGFSWGLAEEAGKAARWLTEQGHPGANLIARLLIRHDGIAMSQLAPVRTEGVWAAPGGMLCPIIAGTALSDRAALVVNVGELTIGQIAVPLVLCYFARALLGPDIQSVNLSWDRAQATVTEIGLHVTGAPAAVHAESTQTVSIKANLAAFAMQIPPPSDRSVSAKTVVQLQAFAQRTYAPATDLSRSAGAGAGETDND